MPTTKSRRKKILGIILLSGYSLYLVTSAIPREIGFPKYIEKPIHWTRKYIVRGGSFVFSGAYTSRSIQKFVCLWFVGVDSQGQVVTLFQSYPDCQPPKVRVFENVLDRAFRRVTQFYKADLIKDVEGGTMAMRRDGLLARIASFYCHSPKSPHQGSQRVFLIWLYTYQDYDTGKIRKYLNTFHGFDCNLGLSMTDENQPWPELYLGENDAPEIVGFK